jgi:enterobacterial common antigen flippase
MRVPTSRASLSLKPAEESGSSYVQILRSSALIGGSTLLGVAVAVIRTKAMAVMLGPAGVGLMGAYGAIADLARAAADMGVNQSGVRQVANAAGTCDEDRIARTAMVVRRTALVLGVAGAVLLAVLAAPVAELTFARAGHAEDVVLLSLAVLLSVIAGGQTALLQGLRRIGDLARIGILGAVTGTLVSLPIVYFWREAGVVPALVALSGISALLAWHCVRRLELKVRPMRWRDMGSEVRELLRLGLAFMTSALLMAVAAYIVRALILRTVGLEGAGFYQAGWAVGGLYVGFILQSMSTDFYPRLVAHVHDDRRCNQIVNEQTRVSMLLAGPGVIATLVLAPLLTTVLYSARFAGAVEVLRWICLGMALKVITWPMGFIVVAKNRRVAFVAVDLAWAFVNVALSWLLIELYGTSGAGIAFFASYVFHAVVIYPVVRRMTGFAWSSDNVRTGLVLVGLASAAFLACWYLPATVGFVVGLVVLAASCVHSVHALSGLVENAVPRQVRRVLSFLRLHRHEY